MLVFTFRGGGRPVAQLQLAQGKQRQQQLYDFPYGGAPGERAHLPCFDVSVHCRCIPLAACLLHFLPCRSSE